MRITGVGGSIGTALAFGSASGRREPGADESSSRALVGVEAPAPIARTTCRHPGAPFLAQLIATHMHAPQTRARRRAEPQEAIAAYSEMAKRQIFSAIAVGKRA